MTISLDHFARRAFAALQGALHVVRPAASLRADAEQIADRRVKTQADSRHAGETTFESLTAVGESSPEAAEREPPES